jgi:hypothetical protein
MASVYQGDFAIDGLSQPDRLRFAMLTNPERKLRERQHECIRIAVLDVLLDHFTNLFGGYHD